MKQLSIERTSGSTQVVQLSEVPSAFGNIYAIGRIVPFFPSLDIEKQYQQLLPNPLPNGVVTEEQRLQCVLQQNSFLARQMGWSFAIGGVPTYALYPRTQTELDAFVSGIVPKDPNTPQFDVIVGVNEPIQSAGEEMPAVDVNWTFSFTLPDLASSVTNALRNQKVANVPANAQIVEIFNTMLQLANNTGDADEHRALNYVSVNYPDVYLAPTLTGQSANANLVFVGVEARRSPLGGGRVLIEVILKYNSPSTGVPVRYFTTVDVTGQFPFLVTNLQPYIDR